MATTYGEFRKASTRPGSDIFEATPSGYTRPSTLIQRSTSQTITPPKPGEPTTPQQEAALIAAGYIRTADGSWKLVTNATATSDPARPGSTPPPIVPTTTTGTTTTTPTTTVPGTTPTGPTTPSGSTPMMDQAFASTDYLSAMLGGALPGESGGPYSSQYTENMQNEVQANPDVMARAVLRQMGMDPGSGYGATIANDLGSISPLIAYLMADTGAGGTAETMDAIGGLAAARAQAGGAGNIGTDIFGQLLNPTSMLGRQMLGLGTGDIGDLPYDQQINAVNGLYGAALNVAVNPWLGSAMARGLNQASTAFTDSYAMDPTGSAASYLDFLRANGYGNAFR